MRTMKCPACGRIASVPVWCARPICVHAWDGNAPDVWDGDNVDGKARLIEDSPNEEFRSPGPNTWTEMEPVASELEHVEAERDRLAEALMLYADEVNWDLRMVSYLMSDRGKTARKALGSLGGIAPDDG